MQDELLQRIRGHNPQLLMTSGNFPEAAVLMPVTRNDDPELVLDNINNAVNRFVGDAEQFDDLTMLCLKYKGPSK